MQVRAQTDRGHVDDLAELFGDKGTWPAALPALTVFHDGKDYFLADGHHRYQAASEAGCAEIPCDIRQGDKTAALWYAIGANAEHGLRRTNEDKRRAVLKAFELDPSLSDNAIAKRCRVSPNMANYTLRPLRSNPPLSQKDSGRPQGSVSTSGEDRAWYAPGETSKSTRTPWDADQDIVPAASTTPASSPSATQTSTVFASPAGSSAVETMAPAIAGATRPAPDIRTDARGRRMDVSKIGKGQKTDKPAPSATAPRGVDELGVPIQTEASAEAFRSLDFYEELDRWAAHGAKLLDQLGKMKGAELLRTNYLKLKSSARDGEAVEHLYSHDLENLRRELAHWRPFAGTCPQCQGAARNSCQICQGLPYVIRAAWDRAPEKWKAAILKMASPAATAQTE